ncbi:MAG: DUF2339 domain-containing protein [Oligoflexales bacterium]
MANLEEILKDFDRRLSFIEAKLSQTMSQDPGQISGSSNVEKSSMPSSPGSSQGIHNPNQELSNKPRARATVRAKARANSAATVSNNPSLDSSSALAIIGIVFVILAGVFFIKITIDSGWLTPNRQILMAAAAGMSFFFAPQFFPKAEKEYGALLAGAGTTMLHLTWLGAYFYHRILGANAALICASLVGVFSLFVNFDKGNRAYILVAMAGTYLSAPIVAYNTGEMSVLSIFLIIWNISFSAASLMNKRRDVMFIACYYAVFTVLLLSGKGLNFEQKAELLNLQLVQFIIFSFAMLTYSVYHKWPLSTDESIAIFPLLLLFYFSTGHLISSIRPGLGPWFGLAIGLFVLAIYFFAHSFLNTELKSGPSLTAFAAMTFVHSFYFQILEESSRPLAALLIGIVVMVLWSFSEKSRETFFWPLLVLLSTFIYGAILTVVSVDTIEVIYLYNWAYGIVALIAVFGFTSYLKEEPDRIQYLPLLLGFAHIEVMLGFYRFSQEIEWSGALFVTFTWGIYASFILAMAYWRHDKILGNSALTILIAVSLKALLYDLSNTSNLIRVGCLLAEGLLLYFCGWVFKKMHSWEV